MGCARCWFKESSVDIIQVLDVEDFALGIGTVLCESTVHYMFSFVGGGILVTPWA
jgi:hypothetical protein